MARRRQVLRRDTRVIGGRRSGPRRNSRKATPPIDIVVGINVGDEVKEQAINIFVCLIAIGNFDHAARYHRYAALVLAVRYVGAGQVSLSGPIARIRIVLRDGSFPAVAQS